MTKKGSKAIEIIKYLNLLPFCAQGEKSTSKGGKAQ
jgi:hypothetical protein